VPTAATSVVRSAGSNRRKELHIAHGARSIEALAAQAILTAAEFDIPDARELVPKLNEIAERLYRATR
jgi:hypothetical protein